MTQHRRVTRIAGLLALPVTAVLVLAGCSGSGSGDAGGDSNSFTFTFATSNNLESPYETLAKEYMAANPGVTITSNPTPNDKYGETIRTQLQAGNASDVIITAPGAGDSRGLIPLAQAGFFEPLGDTATSLVPTGSDTLFELDGKTYGQPLDFTIGAVVASMGTAGMNGITSWPTTMNDFYAECGKLAGDGKSMIAIAGAAAPNAGLTAQGIAATRVYASDPNFNTERAEGKTTFAQSKGWADTLQTIIDLKDKGCFQAGAEGGGFDAITNGLAQGTSVGSFIPSGSAVEIAAAAPAEADFKVQPFPPATGGKPFVLASSNYAASINAKSQKKDAAKKFLEWLATPDAQEKFYEASGLLPISEYKNLDLSKTIYSEVVDDISNGSYTTLPSNVWPNPAVYDALSTGVQGLLTGQSSIDQVLKNMDAAWGN
ncbi:raffinose/stachyose/melibiose transport system substrate-binding protein [Microbacterium sp. AG157]|uniref:ABC transporter substrate-binding protein n=2 Tax=Microbacterium TaxID=33882 RepID=A0A4Y3QMU2_MICTE|nr:MULTISPECIES: extracellular solute-binding protein [Microbacterium]PNW09151.1 sugar ABC transporter substrate-binding protein [Microbacterium testaceum]REC97813.1 raffinose/stachyose/melibiose transport system substrate-binding protein [Microbacterium sp. AG157]GEB46736.1 ABC transporter substrate-binding protein [Microbacterium testaceum]